MFPVYYETKTEHCDVSYLLCRMSLDLGHSVSFSEEPCLICFLVTDQSFLHQNILIKQYFVGAELCGFCGLFIYNVNSLFDMSPVPFTCWLLTFQYHDDLQSSCVYCVNTKSPVGVLYHNFNNDNKNGFDFKQLSCNPRTP